MKKTASWGGWWDSNPRQPEPQSGVLPLNYTHRGKTHYNIREMGAEKADVWLSNA